MSEFELPNYETLLGEGPRSRPLAKKILGLLLKKDVKRGLHTHYKETLKALFPGVSLEKIRKHLISKVTNNTYHLERYNFVVREGRGLIKLKYKTPLCWIANTPGVSFAYLGLLGKGPYEKTETETAIALLKKEGINPKKIIVVTSQEAIGYWRGRIDSNLLSRINWRALDDKKELSDIDKVEEVLKPQIIELMKDYILIMDLTSGPRPAGIAYYETALQFRVPLIYVYEPTKRLRWLISKEKLTKEVGGVFYIEPEEKVEKGEPTRARKRVAIR